MPHLTKKTSQTSPPPSSDLSHWPPSPTTCILAEKSAIVTTISTTLTTTVIVTLILAMDPPSPGHPTLCPPRAWRSGASGCLTTIPASLNIFAPKRDIWKCLETCGCHSWGCRWHLGARGQGCSSTSGRGSRVICCTVSEVLRTEKPADRSYCPHSALLGPSPQSVHLTPLVPGQEVNRALLRWALCSLIACSSWPPLLLLKSQYDEERFAAALTGENTQKQLRPGARGSSGMEVMLVQGREAGPGLRPQGYKAGRSARAFTPRRRTT